VIKLYLPIYFLFKSEWGQLGPDASVGVPTRFVQIVSGLRWQSKKYTTKTMFFNNKKNGPMVIFFWSRWSGLNRWPRHSLLPLFPHLVYKRIRLYLTLTFQFSAPCQSFGPFKFFRATVLSLDESRDFNRNSGVDTSFPRWRAILLTNDVLYQLSYNGLLKT